MVGNVRARTEASFRAGTTACIRGASLNGRGGSGSSSAGASQKRPRAKTRLVHAASAANEATLKRPMQRTDSEPALSRPAPDRVRDAIGRSVEHLFSRQYPDGYWWAELESNVTITAEVILLHRIWGTLDRIPREGRHVLAQAAARARRLGAVLRRRRRAQHLGRGVHGVTDPRRRSERSGAGARSGVHRRAGRDHEDAHLHQDAPRAVRCL